MRRPLILAASALVSLGGPLTFAGVAAAEDEPPRVPAAGVAPSGEISAAATTDVATETQYRDAITAFNADGSGPHTINLTADITITGGIDPDYTNATQPLTIEGNGFTISGGGTRRILEMSTGQQLTVRNLRVEDGFSSGGGGAIEVDGSMVVENSVFAANTSLADGGALDVFDDLTVTNSIFVANTAEDGEGGAVDTSLDEGADITVVGSTFVLNSAAIRGGAISSEGLVRAVNSTFTANEAPEGGAISIGGQDGGEAALVYATITGNSAATAANVLVGEEATISLFAYGTVVADALGGGDNCTYANASTAASLYSYEQGSASCNFTGAGSTANGPDPQLGELGDNGGPTPTMLPAGTSPLVGAIPSDQCVADVPVDQRGIARPQGDGCDIGAVELEVAPLAPLGPPVVTPVVVTPRFTG